jgi:hypothetical protein
MSSRLHNKFHRHNHHTTSVNNPNFPDASYDPIASYSSPFVGPFVVRNPGLTAPTAQSTTNVAVDVAGDINVSGNGNITVAPGGILTGNGAGLYGIVTTSIVNLSGSPYQYSSNASLTNTSILPSLSGIGNSVASNYSVVAGGSGNVIGNGVFSFIAAGSSNSVNHANTFILGSNITTGLPNYTYVNNLSSLGYVYATVVGASAINAVNFVGNGSGINLSTNSLSATTTTLVNTVSTTLNASITSLSASYVSNTTLQSLSGNWQNVYSLVNTTTATTFRVNNLNATGFVNAVSANLGTVGSTATLNVSPLTITGAANGSVFNQVQNTVTGVSASTDISLYNDDSINYLDLGIASTTYNGNLYSPTFNVVNGGDSYVYATNGNLVQGAAAATGNLTFFTGGTLSGNERMRITNTGNVGIGTTAPNQTLTVVGGISATGTLTTNSINVSGNIVAVGDVTGTYIRGNGSLLTGLGSNTISYYVLASDFGPSTSITGVNIFNSVDALAANATYLYESDLYVVPSNLNSTIHSLSASNTTLLNAGTFRQSSVAGISTAGGSTSAKYITTPGSTLDGYTLAWNSGGSNNWVHQEALIFTGSTSGNICFIARTGSYNFTIKAGSWKRLTRIS